MKKIMRKNQMIITSLAILIAVAGYLNFADIRFAGEDKEVSTDGTILDDLEYDLEYDLTDEIAEESLPEESASEESLPGEAVFTSASGFAAQAKISREQIRSQNKENLQEIINNESLSEEQKQEAVSTMVSMAEISEKEAAAELLLEAKGFENVIVNLTGETADIVVPDVELAEAQRAQIEDIVKRKTGIAPENIVISPLNQDSAEEEAETEEETVEDTP